MTQPEYALNTVTEVVHTWNHSVGVAYSRELTLHEAVMRTTFGEARCCKVCLPKGLPKEVRA